ncbi:MAG: amidohydrolase, partial [Deltaproteobacteria bacterium]|nr:amidohydrolase [Deltaproteobacteria bacterium]
MLIDVHAHCFPKPYMEELKKYYQRTNQTQPRALEWEGSEERLAFMDDLGIDVQVLSLSVPNVY